ncbi:MAG: DNA double-strand break repair nuclease NurA [Gemmatimonadetes bacterium]|nr:DNA double-strand break repair nuclease NurA [Gemmatimonadota bacterium]MBT7859779.1 DNA double-strand break repair nuclease NurA [Gemmatimonadota bacterium]
MLDLTAVKTQVDVMVEAQADAPALFEQRLHSAVDLLTTWGGDDHWHQLRSRVEAAHTSWLLADIFGPFAAGVSCPARPDRLTVAATDGSQIFPDRHEISPCYLLNIGYVLLHYGTGERALLSSRPQLYWRDEDLYQEWGGRRSGISRDIVGFRRSLLELTELAELAAASQAEGHPTVALTDGTLIMWSLEGRPADFRDECLSSVRHVCELLAERRVPLAGYISRPGSSDVVNALRLAMCPMEITDCNRCPGLAAPPESFDPASETPLHRNSPCDPLEGITDAVLMRRVLQPGQRSAIFGSRSRVLDDYGGHRIHFFYVHVGKEVARIEIPSYVASNPDLLDRVHACVVDQARKGMGYPVSLAEAHEHAVVRGADREAFYRYLEEMFVRHDIHARASLKGLRKRSAAI